jgi:cyclopropane fatty-acyl-phospholipid synthase-like methyltransferase
MADPERAFENALKARTRQIYDLPVRFWRELLGDSLHFHLGHFPQPDILLGQSARLAVEHLAALMPNRQVARILDVGCGWGGPAFMLSDIWRAEVVGVSVSGRQVRFVNRKAERRKSAVRAGCGDVETSDLDGLGRFDVCWLFEVVEHLLDRRGVLERLHRIGTANGTLAITTTCRSPELPKSMAYSEYLGIAPVDTVDDIHRLVEEAGWRVERSIDCTELTLPIWDRWVENLRRMDRPEWQDTRDRLIVEFSGLGQMFRAELLQSLQLVATAN